MPDRNHRIKFTNPMRDSLDVCKELIIERPTTQMNCYLNQTLQTVDADEIIKPNSIKGHKPSIKQLQSSSTKIATASSTAYNTTFKNFKRP